MQSLTVYILQTEKYGKYKNKLLQSNVGIRIQSNSIQKRLSHQFQPDNL